MSFHRRGERETPPLPVTGREDSPDDVEEVKREPAGVEIPNASQRPRITQASAPRDRVRLPSPPRGGRHLLAHPPGGRRRDERGPSSGFRIPPEVYAGEMGPPRGPMGGRGWIRDPARRGGRGHDHRGGYHHDQMRRNQRRYSCLNIALIVCCISFRIACCAWFASHACMWSVILLSPGHEHC